MRLERLGWLPFIALSALLHLALVLALGIGSYTIFEAPKDEPTPIRVTLLREGPAEAPPAAAPAAVVPEAKVAPPLPKQKPKPRAMKPQSVAAPAPAPAPEAPAPELAGEAQPAAEPSGAVGGTAAAGIATVAAVGSGPPGYGSADPMAAYIALIRERIAKHKRYPAIARRRGIEGRLVVRVEIAADGGVVTSEALGSPSAMLVRSALAAVEAASPFPPPPNGALRIEIPIRYELDGS
jgi:protein TonB